MSFPHDPGVEPTEATESLLPEAVQEINLTDSNEQTIVMYIEEGDEQVVIQLQQGDMEPGEYIISSENNEILLSREDISTQTSVAEIESDIKTEADADDSILSIVPDPDDPNVLCVTKRVSTTSRVSDEKGPAIINKKKATGTKKKKVKKETNEEEENLKKNYICEICGKRLTNHHHLKRHYSVHEETRINYQCDFCGLVFRREEKLVKHMQIHPEAMPYACPICDKRFRKKRTLDRHRLTHGDIALLTCVICQEKFKSTLEYEKHVLKHTSDKPYKCNVCDKSFAEPEYLQQHKQSHLNIRPFLCEICNRRFKRNFELKRHMLTHEGKTRRYRKCDLCNKSILTYSPRGTSVTETLFACKDCDEDFNDKKVAEGDEVKYPCQVCNEEFDQVSLLREHKKIHFDRRYGCKECGMSFRHTSVLCSHRKIHNEERNFVCTICQKAFRRSSHLRDHQRTHSAQKPFKCEKCGMAFRQSSSKRKHTRLYCKGAILQTEKADSIEVKEEIATLSEKITNMENSNDVKDEIAKLDEQIAMKEKSASSNVTMISADELENQNRNSDDVIAVKIVESEGMEVEPNIESNINNCETEENKSDNQMDISESVNEMDIEQSSKSRDLLSTQIEEDERIVMKEKVMIETEMDASTSASEDNVAKALLALITDKNKDNVEIVLGQNSADSEDVLGIVENSDQLVADLQLQTSLNHDDKSVHEEENNVNIDQEKGGSSTTDTTNSIRVPKTLSKQPWFTPFSCDICDKKFLQKHLLKEHRMDHGDKPYPCIKCKKSFKEPEILRDHLMSHLEGPKFKCDQCDRGFTKRSYLDYHLQKHAKDFFYKCGICDEAFTRSHLLEEHVEKHISGKPFKCKTCHKSFRFKCDYDVHCRWHTNDKSKNGVAKSRSEKLNTQYKCDFVCTAAFRSRNDLEAHRKTHPEIQSNSENMHEIKRESGEIKKEDKSDEESESSEYPSELNDSDYEDEALGNKKAAKTKETPGKTQKRDSPRKTAGKPTKGATPSKKVKADVKKGNDSKFTCSKCHMSFKSLKILTDHLSTHKGKTEIKRYKCDNCNKQFTVLSRYESHLQTHTEQHQCGVCKETFLTFGKLQDHLRTSKDCLKGEPFVCDRCGETFSRSRSLKLHTCSSLS